MKNGDHIYLRSASVQAILKKVPHWIIRWGTGLIVLGIGVLFLIAYLIRVPNGVNTPVHFYFDEKNASGIFEDHSELIIGDSADYVLLVAEFQIEKLFYVQLAAKPIIIIQYANPVTGEASIGEFGVLDVSVDPSSDSLTIYASCDYLPASNLSYTSNEWTDSLSLLTIDNPRFLYSIFGK